MTEEELVDIVAHGMCCPKGTCVMQEFGCLRHAMKGRDAELAVKVLRPILAKETIEKVLAVIDQKREDTIISRESTYYCMGLNDAAKLVRQMREEQK